MTQKEPHAATYASKDLGVSIDRPELEALITRAAADPRPFEALIVWRADVLGTPQDAQSVLARLAEHGVRVIATQPIPPLVPQNSCLAWLRRTGRGVRDPEERVHRENARRIISDPATQRILVDAMEANRIIEALENPATAPPQLHRWPSNSGIYVEYSRPLPLSGAAPDTEDLIHGLILTPSPDSADVPRGAITLASQGPTFTAFRHDLYLSADGAPSVAAGKAAAAILAHITAPGAELLPRAGSPATGGRPWQVLLPAPEHRYPEMETG